MDSELKPTRCGCGGEVLAFPYLYSENVDYPYICQCRKCFTRTRGFATKEEAIEAWNKATRGCKSGVRPPRIAEWLAQPLTE